MTTVQKILRKTEPLTPREQQTLCRMGALYNNRISRCKANVASGITPASIGHPKIMADKVLLEGIKSALQTRGTRIR